MKLTIEDIFLHIEKNKAQENSFEQTVLQEIKKIHKEINEIKK